MRGKKEKPADAFLWPCWCKHRTSCLTEPSPYTPHCTPDRLPLPLSIGIVGCICPSYGSLVWRGTGCMPTHSLFCTLSLSLSHTHTHRERVPGRVSSTSPKLISAPLMAPPSFLSLTTVAWWRAHSEHGSHSGGAVRRQAGRGAEAPSDNRVHSA